MSGSRREGRDSPSGIWRRAARYRGALVIVLWQAPLGPYATPDGSVGLLFGGGLDQYVTQFGCEGPSQVSPQSYGVAAIELERNVSETVRLEGVLGGVKWNPTEAGQPGIASSGVLLHGHVRHDGRRFGIGGGLLVQPHLNHRALEAPPSTGYSVRPSAYVRVGSAESLHGRLDLAPPNALGSQVPVRVGLASNAIRRDRPAWFVGLAAVGSSDELLGGGLAAEATLPVSQRAAVRLLGHYGTGYDQTFYGIAAGARIALGSRPMAAAGPAPF